MNKIKYETWGKGIDYIVDGMMVVDSMSFPYGSKRMMKAVSSTVLKQRVSIIDNAITKMMRG